MNLDLKPKNPIASFVDEYGDTRIIHRKQGRRLSVFCGGDTVPLKMNRAAAILIGKNIKQRRLKLSMSQKRLCQIAGFQSVNPKQYISGIENAKRGGGCKTGSLYAIAYALQCEVCDLLPTVSQVLEAANIGESTKVLSV